MKNTNEQYIEADDYYDMALAWFENNDLEKAEECLKHVIELNPHFIYAYITLAEIYDRKEMYGDAIRTLRHGRHFDKTFDRLYYLMSYYSIKNKEIKNALSYIDKALELQPSCEEYLLHKEKILIEKP